MSTKDVLCLLAGLFLGAWVISFARVVWRRPDSVADKNDAVAIMMGQQVLADKVDVLLERSGVR